MNVSRSSHHYLLRAAVRVLFDPPPRRSAMSSIGMMDEAYFVGRNELLAWIKGVTGQSLAKVEEACTGAVYCQVTRVERGSTAARQCRRTSGEAGVSHGRAR